jgi:hypothetical protein
VGPGCEEPPTDESAPPVGSGGGPEQTKDDTDVGWGESADPEAARDDHERWLLEQRPPHWG